ncbi:MULTISPECIES: response regulator transcription factor [Gemmobacter]|uniref:LuxR family two component transcriptional regulator n=2 Tax=Gemmobacter TaxID=204456 RepID=A0A2T6AVM8_9RHOB|nr:MULTISPECIES: response regulator transcription factor [Gemmobacter]PTX47870.1 LuxR family two component transcriptional regulator [Gemmobacter caeni]TWI97408.1 LuxR family two component transcriptional regulator [Gemmobacter caeni]GHC31100.1 LuxR family transcriptional regulator [Gemmobacter nanjingensis]
MAETPRVSLLIADDHQLIRDLVATHLRAQGFDEVVAVESFETARTAIARHGCFSLVLLDLSMPGVHGMDSVAALIAENAGGRLAVFSGQAQPEMVTAALARGASGFIPKSTPAQELAAAIHRILGGEIYLPEGFDPVAPRPWQPDLTPRERETLGFLRDGLMNKEIALRMGLSEVTVKMHVKSICAKLNARNRTHAVILASAMMLD